jgi:GT2 family glycosyltransferase
MIPKVVIVVLNYNGAKCLSKTLQSLGAVTYQNKEILVVDNDSQDSSFAEAQELFPTYSYVQLPVNGGFAYGMNKGIEYALSVNAAYVWLFNYDAQAKNDSLEKLVEESIQLDDKALLSPQITDQDGNIWFAGGKISYFRMRVIHTKRNIKRRGSIETKFLTGCALFLPVNAIKKIGMLDERFFLYYEDADYSQRALKEGLSLRVVSEAKVLHSEESKENPSKTYHLVLSGLRYFSKHQNTFFSFYQAIYVILRRLKNQGDLLLNKPFAKEVNRAYQEFYGECKPSFFNHLRKL